MYSQTVEDQANQKEKYFGWHVVAFLDLLGQQDKLSKISALPNVENQEEFAAFKLELADCYKPLSGLRTLFNTGIKAFIQGSIDETALLPFQREILIQLRSTPIFYRHISDLLIVHLPLRDNLGKFPCRAIYSVLVTAATTFLSCMAHSWAIRGGIELGLAMDIEEGEIYGSALSRAHYLESRVAKYPRIVIGQELVRYLQFEPLGEKKKNPLKASYWHLTETPSHIILQKVEVYVGRFTSLRCPEHSPLTSHFRLGPLGSR